MVGTMIVGYLAGVGAAGVAASYALTAAAFAVNFAVSQIVSRVFADNPETQQDMGVRQQVPPSAVNAVPVVYGDAYMGGTFVDAVLTTDQKTMYYVMAISSISSANSALGTSAGVFNFDRTKMYYGDRLITFDSTDLTKVVSLTDEAGNVDTKISGNLYINLYKSSSSGVITSANGASAPSTVMGGSDIAVAQRWTGTRQMNNLAFAIVKLVYNRDADTTQLNPITFRVSHYPNGASVAKPGDVWLDYITNQDYGGAVGWLPNGSFSASFVDTSCVAALNTYSDEVITYTPSTGGSATQARYRINGVLDAGQSVLSNLDRIMSACDSWMTYNAALGQWSVVINKAETAAFAFNDNNIIGDIRVSATDITSSINQVEARFPFKENRDQAAFVNLETPYALLYPNEPVNKYSITYDLVNDSVQAQYLANRLLEQAREDLIVSFSTTYYGIQVDAGQVVSVTNADYGWTNKLFRVMKVNEASLPDGSLGAKLELNEYNVDVYDNASITQFTAAPNSGLASPSYFSALSTPTATGFPSATIPYINVQVTVPTTGRVTFGNLFWTTVTSPSSTDWKLVSTATTTNNQPVTNGSSYTFSNITLNTGTYYFAYNVGNDVTTSALSPISSALVWNPVAGAGAAGPFVDISGFTGFSKNAAGTAITPATATLTAITQNVTTPTYSWVITGATPTTGTASTITITPSLSATSVTATLTVNGTNLTNPIVRAITMPITLDGTGTAGLNSATVNLYNKNTSTTPPALFSGTFTYTFATGVLSGGTLNGWSQTPPSIAAGEFLFLSLATASSSSATDSIATSEFSTPTVISGTGATGASGSNTAIVSLFNKNTSAVTPPTSFSGTFTYTFATAVLSGGTLNGWTQSAPTLATGEYLWERQATAFSSATTDTIASTEFSGAVVVGAAGNNGATGPTGASVTGPTGSTGPTGASITGPTGQAGLQVARPAVYQWGLSTPSISGSSTYTWATAAYTAPSGWSTTITAAPSAGFILYTATVTVTDVATATSTAFSWTTASIIVSGYAGTNGATGPTGGAGATGPTGGSGASSRIMYARIASNPTPVTGIVTVSGDNRPTGAEGSAVWGSAFNVTWAATDPNPSSNDSLYQSDGIYNGSTTAWTTPYISALKVGALSAVSTNTGSLTVSGTIQSNNAAISGTTMTGSGGVLYASGNFAFGNETTNIAFNGTQMTLNGNVVATSNIGAAAVTNANSAYTGGGINISKDAAVDTVLQQVTLTCTGERVFLSSTGRIELGYNTVDNTYEDIVCVLYYDETPIDYGWNQMIFSFSGVPSAGSHTFSVRAHPASTYTTGSAGIASSRSMFVLETKR